VNTLSGRIITLDPGHGEISPAGNDPGAVNRKLKLTERDVVRTQANILTELLSSKGATVRILENNTTKTLQQLGADAAGSHAFVSLHLNAFNGNAQGHEVLIHTKATEADAKFAMFVSNELGSRLAIPNRGVKRQNLAILYAVAYHIPAILTESFFIDSVPDRATLDQLLYISSDAIAVGIEKFLSRR
jgi:N-acetylmuramoyl-L-alanine amidase